MAFAPEDSPDPDEKGPGAIRQDRGQHRCLREQLSLPAMYGNPVLEWWRPGGSVLALRRQGSQADLSLPPSCDGVSYYKQNNEAHISAWDP